MKKILILAAIVMLSGIATAQNNIYATAGIAQTMGPPTFVPGARGSVVAIDTLTGLWWVNPNRMSGSTWIKAGHTMREISGCVAPASAPTKFQSWLVSNTCTTPAIYLWDGSAWDCLNCASGGATVITDATIGGDGSIGSPLKIAQQSASSGQVLKWNGTTWLPSADAGTTYTGGTGIDITGTVITNTAPDQTVSISGAGINVATGTYPNFTVTGTEVDGSTTNEIQHIDTLSLSGSTLSASLSSDGVPAKTVNLSGLQDGNGLYSGSGTVAANTVATIPATGTGLAFNYHSGNGAVSIMDGGLTLGANDLLSSVALDGAGVTASSPAGSVTLGTNDISIISNNDVDVSAGGDLFLHTSGGTTGAEIVATAGETKLVLKGSNGDTEFLTRNQSGSDITYQLPTSAAASNGDVLTSTTAGVLSWATPSGGGGATDLSISGTSSPLALNSSTGADVTLTAGTGISLAGTSGNATITNTSPDQTVAITGAGINVATGTYPNFTVTGTEVDGSVSNEGSLTVGAGSGTTSTIVSNTSGSTAVTISASTGLSTSEAGNTITLTNTAPDQTVSITGAGINVATGTYPNFTVTGTEVDGSTTNEIQTYGHSGTTTYTNTLSLGGGSWSITGTGIAAISNTAGAITVTATEVDGSTTNEIQQIDTFAIVSNVLRASLSSDAVPFKSVDLSPYLDNTDAQTLTNTSDATSHTVTLSGSGNSVQLVEGSGITLTTTGTSGAGVVTIASTGGGSGDITNGGNTTGAAVTIGTNDANALNLETNNVTRLSITGGASTGGAITTTDVTANTSTVEDAITVQTNSSGTAAAGFGARQLFNLESSTTDNQNAASIGAEWSDATHATRTGDLVFSTVASAGSLTEALRIGSTDRHLTATASVANTNTVNDRLVIRTNSSGTAATSFGGGILFQGESTTTDNRDMARITSYWTTATDASRTSKMGLSFSNSAGALTEQFTFSPSGLTIANTTGTTSATITNTAFTPTASYTIGPSGSNALTLGASGTVTINTSNASTSAISIYASANSAASTANIGIGNGISFTQTSGTRDYINYTSGFAPTSGTAVHNQLSFTGTLNQTGGASGIVRGINLAHTVTAVADYRAIEIADNGTNVKGIYQTGSTTVNNLVGKTTFGATTAPTALIFAAAGTTTVPPLQFAGSGTLLTTPLALAVEPDVDVLKLTTTTNTIRRTLEACSTGRATAQTAANTSVATYTLGATDATYEVSANVLVTTSSAEAFTVTVDYTDEGNTARTATLNFQLLSGTIGTAINFANGAVPYAGIPIHIRCKASTAITVKTTGTFTGSTYNCEGTICQKG